LNHLATRHPTPATHHASGSMSDDVRIRIHGRDSLPTLIYLPGIHGNWMLIGGLRRALGNRVRFVELSYPNTLTWSLQEHAAAVEAALAAHGVGGGWLLAESFSSQVVWPIVASGKFQVRGVILAGGFVRHPLRWEVRLAQRISDGISFSVLAYILFVYARVSRFRFRRSPETFREIQEFIAGLTQWDLQAAKHRLHLIAQSDPRSIVRRLTVPVYALTGLFDPVVPWLAVRRWLKRNCPTLREYKIIWRADHNVLGTAPDLAAEHIVRWMSEASPKSE